MTGSVSGLNGAKINPQKGYNNPMATVKDNQVKNIFNDYLDKTTNTDNFVDVTKDNILDIKKQIEQTNEQNGVIQTSYDKKTGTSTYSDGSKLIYKEGKDNKANLEYIKKYADGSMAYGSMQTGGADGSDTDRVTWGSSDGKLQKTGSSRTYVKNSDVTDNSTKLFSSYSSVNTVDGVSKVKNVTSTNNIFGS